MNVLDLFSGIGGFSLGLERAGMRTVAFCEIDQYCQRVLRKHWPTIPVYDDVRTLTAATLGLTKSDGCGAGRAWRSDPASAGQQQPDRPIQIDVICGGFPCQDISVAGKGAGLAGERSGLWSEYARIIGEVRPRYVIVENVAALLSRGLADVLGDLAALGYDTEWHCIPASAVGAPHRRDRVWIVAYPTRDLWRASGYDLNDTSDGPGDHVADADQPRLEGWLRESLCQCAEQQFAWARGASVSDANSEQAGRATEPWRERSHWELEPAMGELVDGISNRLVRFRGRVATGVPNRVKKLRALGNAVIPQIPELIGRAIMEHYNA